MLLYRANLKPVFTPTKGRSEGSQCALCIGSTPMHRNRSNDRLDLRITSTSASVKKANLALKKHRLIRLLSKTFQKSFQIRQFFCSRRSRVWQFNDADLVEIL